ncbi:2-amino-4-hydroxy-6-hydroxymethyldihydropteridine diphosphokinase [Streptomyces sp. RS10V-4]|uniref:2-amino-4-hydroxy-6- hydroxymethyldihydropteridine diphosphokinase n=1 Tax=Streptomyces rhizoryzae TaxID=2932493 RepID=UPI00200487AF|nr:2-amino-4-hydroxy-6-hydroxymethyldihydropteridine diphosphokinase [Streptomyces rhizoryzae]MCK7627958.1 2-amino-4-hydroxy-6-hydroxymethyldihydropteridine diphosphokinase [Streptomyces rhizoryzae]
MKTTRHPAPATASRPAHHVNDPTVQPVPASVVEQVDAADVTLSNPKRAVISLGSNLGNRLETLQGAVDALEDTPGVRVKAVSPVYETEPWGVEPGSQPSYFNAVVLIKTTLPPESLLERGHAIEEAFERVRDERWGPRTIDVDIVAYQDVVSDDPLLTLPHPRAHERAFVLVPWHDIDPEAEVPGRGAVAALLASLGSAGVAPRADLELRLPE